MTFLRIILVFVGFVGVISCESDKQFSSAVLSFANNIFKIMCNESYENNVVLSPINILSTLLVLKEGAGGSTLTQMENVLGSEMEVGFKNLFSECNDGANFGNRIYIKPEFELNSNFEDRSKSNYHVSFHKGISANDINEWIASLTKGHITEIASQSDIDENTVMIIYNVIFLKAKWETPFPKGFTYKGNFFAPENAVITVDYMNLENNMAGGFFSSMQFKWVKIPYKDSKLAMIILLPTGNNTVYNLINNLNTLLIENLMQWKKEKRIELRIPKFKVNVKTSLRGPLENLGLSELFSQSTANLTGISREKGQDRLFVSQFSHQTVVKVNEEGTEAAAVSTMSIRATSLIIYKNKMKFTVDRPFVFIIVDNDLNIPLFMGKITNPES